MIIDCIGRLAEAGEGCLSQVPGDAVSERHTALQPEGPPEQGREVSGSRLLVGVQTPLAPAGQRSREAQEAGGTGAGF